MIAKSDAHGLNFDSDPFLLCDLGQILPSTPHNLVRYKCDLHM